LKKILINEGEQMDEKKNKNKNKDWYKEMKTLEFNQIYLTTCL
jgi:hypothetical protein